MMNLVMFGYFATGRNFEELTSVNLKDMMFAQRVKEIEDELVPFGYIDDGISNQDEEVLGKEKSVWTVDHNFKSNMVGF